MSLYPASVPVFQHYLARLRGLVDKAQQGGLLDARLAPDMHPFHAQVAVAVHFTLRACFPLAGEAVPAFGDFPPTAAGLQTRIDRASALLAGLAPARFEGAEARVVTSVAGETTLVLPAAEFLHTHAAPNFFFHLSMAYAVLRHHGVPVGKQDFDGQHRY